MKKIVRMLLFSAIGLYVTTLWNKGFLISTTLPSFLYLLVIVSIAYYFILPIAKTILLPLNILTLGLLSLILYVAIFYAVDSYTTLLNVTEWTFGKTTLFNITLEETHISYSLNLLLSSLSLSAIINTLEKLT